MKNGFKRKMLAAVTGLVLALSVGGQAPAQAALGDCTAYSGVLCLWKNAGQGGSIWRQTRAEVSASCTPLTKWAGWNDTVTSFRNQMSSAYVMELYWDNTCIGAHLDAYYGYNYDLTGNSWDNEVSGVSWRFA